MSLTDDFRRQHTDLVALVTEISGLLQIDTLADDATQVRALLATLSGKIGAHLAMEDRALYPKMLSSDDELASKTAQRFIDEMGGISAAFKAYMGHWPHAKAIQADPTGFGNETKAIFTALAKRIECEDNELYAVADKL